MKRFNPEKEIKNTNKKLSKKHILISVSVLMVFTIIGLSFALFNLDNKEFVVLNSKVGEFTTGDIVLKVMVDGVEQESFPSKDAGYVFEQVICTNGSTGTWDADAWELTVNYSGQDECVAYFTNAPLLSSYIKGLYTSDGINSLYYHDADLTNGAGDSSYRYSGTDPENYVCLGSDAETCPTDNMYRIIGVFGDDVKLIKNVVIGTNYWSTTGANTWSTSTLNTTLNDATSGFLSTLGSWSSYVKDATWYVGGASWSYMAMTNAKTAYDYELGANSNSTVTVTAKIGLIYLSDYFYGALPTYWTYPGRDDTNSNDYRNAAPYNWLAFKTNEYEWTITPDTAQTTLAYGISSAGIIGSSPVSSYADYVRPTLYLASTVRKIGGTGTSGDPYRLTM